MRTILFVLISFILVIAFQQCNKTEFIISPNNSIKTRNDTIIYYDVKCLPCCIDILDYYGGTLLPPEQIPENIVNIVGYDETIIEH